MSWGYFVYYKIEVRLKWFKDLNGKGKNIKFLKYSNEICVILDCVVIFKIYF